MFDFFIPYYFNIKLSFWQLIISRLPLKKFIKTKKLQKLYK